MWTCGDLLRDAETEKFLRVNPFFDPGSGNVLYSGTNVIEC